MARIITVLTRRATARQAEALDPEEGSTTVEYALGAVSAAALAGALLAVVKSGAVQAALEALVTTALAL